MSWQQPHNLERIPSINTFLEFLLLSYCFQGGSLQVLVHSLTFCSRNKVLCSTIHVSYIQVHQVLQHIMLVASTMLNTHSPIFASVIMYHIYPLMRRYNALYSKYIKLLYVHIPKSENKLFIVYVLVQSSISPLIR